MKFGRRSFVALPAVLLVDEPASKTSSARAWAEPFEFYSNNIQITNLRLEGDTLKFTVRFVSLVPLGAELVVDWPTSVLAQEKV